MGMHSDENGPWTCLPGPHRYHGGGREESARICGHASEDERNRQVFQNYLHSTLNLSKAEWLAEKLSPAIHALLGRYKHRETGKQHNVIVDEVFVKWREEKETIMNPTTAPKPKHPRKTPDVAKAEDLTKVNTSPPEDKAIRKDVPFFGPSTDISSINGCLNDVVTQDDDGKTSYEVLRGPWYRGFGGRWRLQCADPVVHGPSR